MTTCTLSSPDTTAQSPAVTVCRDGGFAAVYRHCSPSRELRFRRRGYGGPWSDPVPIADNEPYWSRPGIEYLGNDQFGVVYLSNTGPVVRGAFFDRGDWVYGVAGEPRSPSSRRKLQATIVRGVLMMDDRGPKAGGRAELLDAAGRKVMDLQPGANDVRTLAPGVYFVRPTSVAMRDTPSVAKVVVTR